jgi:hypothetical protein
MKLSEDIPISTEHFNVIISLFLQFVDESIEKVTIEQPQAAAEVRHSHLYALSPKSPSSIELVHLQLSQIRSHLSPSISIKNIMRLFKGISLVAQCQAWVDEKTLSEISKICEKALHIVLHSEHLQVGMVECLAKWNDPAFQIQQSSLHEPACLFLVATPVIIHNLRKLKEKTAPDHSIDIQKLQRLQREFLIKIDDVLVKKSNKSIDQIIFIYKAIHSNAVEAVLNFMDGFFDYCQVDGGIERSLQNCRILMGLGYFITQDLGTKMMISSHPQIQKECEVLDQSLQNITQLIFSLLQTIISKGMGLRGLRLDEIMKTGIQTFLIHPEDGLERLYNMIEKILHAELKRPNPDPNVILSILEYMADISDMQHFNANTKIKMRELALRLWDPSKLNTKLEGCVDLVIPTKVKASLQPHFTSKILSLFSQKSETKPSVEPRRGLASSALEGMMQNIALPEIASQARAAAEPKTDVAPKEEAVGFSKFLTTIMSGFFSS